MPEKTASEPHSCFWGLKTLHIQARLTGAEDYGGQQACREGDEEEFQGRAFRVHYSSAVQGFAVEMVSGASLPDLATAGATHMRHASGRNRTDRRLARRGGPQPQDVAWFSLHNAPRSARRRGTKIWAKRDAAAGGSNRPTNVSKSNSFANGPSSSPTRRSGRSSCSAYR